VFRANHLHDLGKLMLTFVMLWAYFQFSQFLIIWSGNLPEEIGFYLTRIEGAWVYLSAVLILGHFALPFVLLLNRDLKQSHMVALVAIFVIGMRFVDLFWLMGPRDGHTAPALSWINFVTPVRLAASGSRCSCGSSVRGLCCRSENRSWPRCSRADTRKCEVRREVRSAKCEVNRK
jgi:hypothetical protein